VELFGEEPPLRWFCSSRLVVSELQLVEVPGGGTGWRYRVGLHERSSSREAVGFRDRDLDLWVQRAVLTEGAAGEY